MKTARGIYYNLEESNYIFEYKDLTFVFSSQFYLNKFKNEHELYKMIEKEKLKQRYNINIQSDYLFLILLYREIEKRGFLIYHKKEKLSKEIFSYFEIDMYHNSEVI